MEDQKILGNRIRTFRKRAGLSQMDLEIEMEASPGSLSRIESGEVNPTKETVSRIAEKLHLSNQEEQYLLGNWFYPANKQEVESALVDIKDYFNKKGVLAYVLDERFRFISISKSFQRLLGFNDAQVEEARLMPYIKLILSNKFGVRSLVPKEAFEEIINNLLISLYSDCGFMEDDEVYQEQIKAIQSDILTRELWKKIIKNPIRKYNDIDTRRVVFKFFGQDVPMIFSRDPLYRNRRFEIVEFSPEHKFIKFITSLIM